MKKTQLTLTITPALKKRIKLHCATNGVSITELVTKAVTGAVTSKKRRTM